jgi:hypothetical protein
MIRYELLMAWRRRSLLVSTLFLMGGLALFAITFNTSGLQVGETQMIYLDDTVTPPMVTLQNMATGETTTVPADQNTLEAVPTWLRNVDIQQASATFQVATILTILAQLLIILLLLMSAETFPLDKVYQVRELLDTAPLGKATYIIGKLGGLWAGLLLGLIASMLIFIPISQWRFGDIDLSVYLRTWFVLLILVSIFASGLGALAASGMGSRRGAVLVGLALMPVGVFVFALIVGAFFVPLLNLSTVTATYEAFSGQIITSVGQIMLAANLAMIGVGVLVWGLMRARDGR